MLHEVVIEYQGNKITLIKQTDEQLAELLKSPTLKVIAIDRPKAPYYPYRRRKGKK